MIILLRSDHLALEHKKPIQYIYVQQKANTQQKALVLCWHRNSITWSQPRVSNKKGKELPNFQKQGPVSAYLERDGDTRILHVYLSLTVWRKNQRARLEKYTVFQDLVPLWSYVDLRAVQETIFHQHNDRASA